MAVRGGTWDRRDPWAQRTDGWGRHGQGIRANKTAWVILRSPLGLHIFTRQSPAVSHPKIKISKSLWSASDRGNTCTSGKSRWICLVGTHIYLGVLPSRASSRSATRVGKIKRAVEQPGWGNAGSWRKGII